MFHPPKKSLLALEAMLYIASHTRSHPINSKELSANLGFPVRYLEQLMQKLVHAQILRGVRGPRGGYVLARERRRITVADILRALSMEEDTSEKISFGSALGRDAILPMWEQATGDMIKHLENVTLEKLCRTARRSSTPDTGEDTSFII